ncbi:MAG TPA: MerR family transcriptional regulator [Ktedonobacterales bacterium]|nr:MerR family transcriptional regulator [Ktedonobacterales bacterium]
MSGLVRIGDFSRLGRVSVVTLRHYDDLGLLKPAHTDPESGYRYYAVEQLPRLHRILALKELGFSLEQIAQLLRAEVSAEQMRGMLVQKRSEIERELLAQQARLASVEARLRHIEREGSGPASEVVLRPVAPQLVASLRAVVPTLDAVERLFEEAEAHAARYRARADAPPTAIYHDADYREREVDVEVTVPLSTRISDGPRVVVRELPGAEAVACVVHAGSYATIDQTSAALLTWIAAQGYRVAGAYREVYLRFGVGGLPLALPPAYLARETDEYLTELQVPVERAG